MRKDQILVTYGSDLKRMAGELMAAADVQAQLKSGMRIALKPNLVVAKPSSTGATTSPELAAGIVEYLLEYGFKDIDIIEGSWVGDDTGRAFEVCGYRALAKRYGLGLYDLKRDATVTRKVGGETLTLCRRAAEADFLINMPVLKAHCQTALTCALKNMKGCIPDREKRRFHQAGLHGPIGALAKALPPQLTVVDGLCGDLTFEEGGTPVQMNRAMLAWDPVKMDAYAAELIGLELSEVPYIGIAERLGAGSTQIGGDTVIELNRAEGGAITPQATRRVAHLAAHVEASQACSACYGSLIHALQRMDEIGQLGRLKGKVHIGQGNRGKAGAGIGIGACCKGYERCVMGCPPSAREILAELTKER